MAEPHIRYVHSADGTKIATATLGSGPYLVMVPPTPFWSIEGEWSMPMQREAIERIAARYTLVRYDPRGQGLSDREVDDLSLEARVADLEAVFESVPTGPAFVYSRGWQAPATITFAARHPDRVRRLVLSGAAARGQDFRVNDKRRAVGRLLEVDWDLYCAAFAFADFGWTEEGRQYALMISRATTPDFVPRNWTAMRQYDATDQPVIDPLPHPRDLSSGASGWTRRLRYPRRREDIGSADPRRAFTTGRGFVHSISVFVTTGACGAPVFCGGRAK